MILKFDDGSELELAPSQFENFSFLKYLPPHEDDCILTLEGVDSTIVSDIFDFYNPLCSDEMRKSMFQKTRNSGYVRDFVTLCVYLGYDGSNQALSRVIESLLQTESKDTIRHAFGL